MMLDWQEEKKTCSEFIKVEPPSSDKFRHLFDDAFGNEWFVAKISFV